MLVKLGKMFFYFTSKALFIIKKIKVENIRFSVLWRHQMPKHKTINTCYWITWEVKTIYFMSHHKRKNIIKNSCKNCDLKTLGPFVFWKNWAQSLLENEIFDASYLIKFVKKKPWKFVQISLQTSSDSLLRRILWKLKRPWN